MMPPLYRLAIMSVGSLTILIALPGCKTLKDKRSRIRPILARLHRQFNVATAETASQDSLKEAILTVVGVSNERPQVERELQSVLAFVADSWPDSPVLDYRIQFF